jgi:hypothetical protein
MAKNVSNPGQVDEVQEAVAKLEADPERSFVVIPKKFRVERIPKGEERRFLPKERVRYGGGKYRLISLR